VSVAPIAELDRGTTMSIEALADRFRAIYTGALTDVLDDLGLLNQTLSPELRPLRPGMTLCAPAFTIDGRPRAGIDYGDSIVRILDMLGAVPAHHVAVYETNDSASAHLGELSVVSLATRGCAGAVIDGGCRDVDAILNEGLPVFSRYVTPQDCVPRWELLGTSREVTVGGVRISPGDWIVADADGIVAVPRDVCEDVLAKAEALVATENKVREAVRGGTLPREAFKRYGTF
jgi:4-hydroxy-4-methyl-2-oxoglutarate aldolase